MAGKASRAPAKPAAAWRGGAVSGCKRGVKAAVSVALDIARDITAQRLKAGDKLPREAELLAHYGVSRASLREGVRILEVQGLLSIRPGPGGVVVGAAHPANLGRSLTVHLQF
ncbi:MAG: FadR family transcriptional regulator, partial [Betaproteobacteria bacterium]|nr:FadR family transcriptional regulator [Betaproteobacteria bacterium]